MSSVVTQRFVACHHKLKADKVIPSSRQFALSLDYLPQSLSEILKGRRDVTIELLRKAVEKYRLNPVFLYTGQGPMFMAQPAEEPAFTFLDADPASGTHRTFTVNGDAMEPTLYEGDQVVCHYLEPKQWADGIRNQGIYVLVTPSQTHIRRALNRIPSQEAVELVTDNDFYHALRLPVVDIREIWEVRAVVSARLSAPRTVQAELLEELGRLRESVRAQAELLQHLASTVRELRTQLADS